MKAPSIQAFRRTASIFMAVVFIACANVAQATTIVVKFGNSLGDTYSPSLVHVSVGDVIEWQGPFSFHPLSSVSVPAGAASFHNTSGSTFDYTVSVPGTYNYQCDDHVSLGMTGSFTTLGTAGVEKASLQPDAFRLGQNYPNPFNPTTNISFDLPSQSFVSIKVYNLMGQEMATIENETMAAGSYSKSWNAAAMPSGVYFYRMETGNFIATKKLILMK